MAHVLSNILCLVALIILAKFIGTEIARARRLWPK